MVRWKSNRLIDVYRCWIASCVPHLFYLWWILPFHPGLPVRHGALRRPWRGPCPPTPIASFCFIFLQHTGLLPNLQEKPEQKPKEIPSCTYFLGSSEHGEIYELHTAIFMVNVMNLLRILGAPPYVEKNTCARLISCNKDRWLIWRQSWSE